MSLSLISSVNCVSLASLRKAFTLGVRCFNSSVPQTQKNEYTDQLWDQTVSNKARNELFDKELHRQRSLIPRLEKIEVEVYDIKPHENVTLLMNKNLSTPYECAQHISELYIDRSVVAKVDNERLWDMHRPLEKDCRLTFKHFRDSAPQWVNTVFWRTCSFMLGMVLQRAFKSEIPVLLHSWPKPSIRSGSFIYDVQLPSLSDWKPTSDELRCMTAMFWKLKALNSKFERLDVNIDLAKEIFKDNPHKSNQISNKLNNDSDNKITLYRLCDHIDMSVGPMIANTSQIGRVSVTCVHKLDSSIENLYRFQGVAIPTDLPIHFFPYRVLVDRASKPNLKSIPP